jgi:hypothetical protein
MINPDGYLVSHHIVICDSSAPQAIIAAHGALDAVLEPVSLKGSAHHHELRVSPELRKWDKAPYVCHGLLLVMENATYLLQK